MSRLARAGAVSPYVRTVAASIVRGSPNSDAARAVLLSQWVCSTTEFLPDPSTCEALIPPENILDLIAAHGVAQIDCDDVAILAAALGLSIGLRARFTVVAFDGSDAPYAHVFAELAPATGGQWLTVDPARPTVSAPAITRSASVEV